MTKGKHAALIELLGSNMNESAGSLGAGDRFEGFVPGTIASGEMPLDRICEDPNQPRKTFDQQALQELAENIKSHGIQQPIQLRWSEQSSEWLIVYGHRRYRAAKLAGLATIPCTFTNEDIDEPTLRVRQLIENCQRENLAPVEMARGLAALSKLTGWSNRRMGQELGVSNVTVGRYLDLLELPEDVQELVETRKLAPSVASEISKVESSQEQSDLAREISQQQLTRSEAKARIDKTANTGHAATKQGPSREKELMTSTLSVAVYRDPRASDLKIKQDLLAIAERIDTEKAES